MKAGRELDALIAEKVMGWKAEELKRGSIFGSEERDLPPGTFHFYDGQENFKGEIVGVAKFDKATGEPIPAYPWCYLFGLPKYSEDLEPAMQVALKIMATGKDVDISMRPGWEHGCRISPRGEFNTPNVVFKTAPTVPHAICLAAAKAMGVL
jgi:hypothetical protein